MCIRDRGDLETGARRAQPRRPLQDRRRWLVARRADHPQVHVEQRRGVDPRGADVVPIADVRDGRAGQLAGDCPDGHAVGEHLAGMLGVGEGVDHG